MRFHLPSRLVAASLLCAAALLSGPAQAGYVVRISAEGLLGGAGTLPEMPVEQFSPVSLSTGSLEFGQRAVGESATQSVLVTNAGPHAASLQSIHVVNSTLDPDAFSATSTCAATLAPGQSCQVSVRLQSLVQGSHSGVLRVVDSLGTRTTDLSGQIGAPYLFVTGGNNFGHIFIGESKVLTNTVYNTGTAPTVLDVHISAPGGAEDFVISGGTCQGATLAPSENCQIEITGSPTTTNTRTAQLVITGTHIAGMARPLSIFGVRHMELTGFTHFDGSSPNYSWESPDYNWGYRLTSLGVGVGTSISFGGVSGTVGWAPSPPLSSYLATVNEKPPVGSWPITLTNAYETVVSTEVRANINFSHKACFSNLGDDRIRIAGRGLFETGTTRVVLDGVNLPVVGGAPLSGTPPYTSMPHVVVQTPPGLTPGPGNLRVQRFGAPSDTDRVQPVTVANVKPAVVTTSGQNVFDVPPAHLEWVESGNITGWLYYNGKPPYTDLRRTYPGGPVQYFTSGLTEPRSALSNLAAPGRGSVYSVANNGDVLVSDAYNFATQQVANLVYLDARHIFLSPDESRLFVLGENTSGRFSLNQLRINTATGWLQPTGHWTKFKTLHDPGIATGSLAAEDNASGLIFLALKPSTPGRHVELYRVSFPFGSVNVVEVNHVPTEFCGDESILANITSMAAWNNVVYLSTPTAIFAANMTDTVPTFHVIAGSPYYSGEANGTGRNARFQSIGAMTMYGTTGTLMVADGRHYRLVYP